MTHSSDQSREWKLIFQFLPLACPNKKATELQTLAIMPKHSFNELSDALNPIFWRQLGITSRKLGTNKI